MNKKNILITDNLFLYLKPKINRNLNLIYSELTEELIQMPLGRKLVLNNNLPIHKIVQLMDGKNTIKKISKLTLTFDKDILKMTYLLDKKGFFNKKEKTKLRFPIFKIKKNMENSKKITISLLGQDKINKNIEYCLSKQGFKNLVYIDSSFSKKKISGLIKKSDLVIGSFKDKRLLNLFINKLCLLNKIKWISYNLDLENLRLDIGPFIYSVESSCFACYQKRLRESSIFTNKDYIFKSPNIIPIKLIRNEYLLLAISISNCIISFLSKSNFMKGKILSIDLKKGVIKQNTLLKDPLCNSCRRVPFEEKITLKHRKVAHFENGLRIFSAKKTWLKVKKLISHVGIVSKEICFRNVINNQYNYKAFSADPLGNNKFRVHTGKGISLIQNRNSAVLEAIERYCAKYAMLDPFKMQVIGSFNELKNLAIHPHQFQIPLARYSDKKKIKWIKAWSLTNNRQCLLPLGFVSYIPFGSNGLAAGNCIEEAILHGIFELVERDIYTIMDLNEIVMPDVDCSNIRNKKIKKIFADLDNSNIYYRIKYILNTHNIPTFGMYIKGRVANRVGYSHAVCSHLYKEIAFSRTVTEAIQVFPRFVSEGKWLNKNTDHYTKPSKIIKFDEIRDSKNLDIKDAIDNCISIFKKQGLETFVVNHSLPNIDFSVVRVLVAGLQPIWFKESPYLVDRVFTVPEILGFKKKSRKILNYGDYAGSSYIK